MPHLPNTLVSLIAVHLAGLLRLLLLLFGACSLGGFSSSAVAQWREGDADASHWRVELEVQRVNTTTNVFRKGDDYGGSRIDMTAFAGSRQNELRLSAFSALNWLVPGDRLRFIAAPFRQKGSTVPAAPLVYDGVTFRPGLSLEAEYKFDTYRLTYERPFLADQTEAAWQFRLGGTLAVRDARIRLAQGSMVRDFKNRGPVPLLYFRAQRELAHGWKLAGEMDAFPAPGGGGLFDGAVKLMYRIAPHANLSIGTRYQFGGASQKDFYNFLRQWSGVASVEVRF